MEPHGQNPGEILQPSKIRRDGWFEPRRLIWAVAEVCWADAAGHSIRSRATIVDISASGACIRLKDRIGVGSQLTIRWHREQFAATARNCRPDGADYLLGVRRDNSSSTLLLGSKSSPEAHAASMPTSDAPAGTISRPAPAPATAAARDAALQKTELKSSHKPTEALERRPTPARHAERRIAVTPQKVAREERKAMEPKRLFPNFWRQRSDDAPIQLAPKEAPVNKPIRAVEPVNDPPARLLSYEDIYHAAGIMSPRSGYDIRKVVDMLNSDRIRDLSKDIQRASVLMALDAAGASIGELLQDATRRQQTLNAYEEGQRKQLQEFEARKAQENAQIEAEMQRVTAHYAERIQQNQDEVAKHKEALHNWQMAKQHESQRITDVMELCGKQTVPAAENSVAAAAGVAGPAGGAVRVRPDDASKSR